MKGESEHKDKREEEELENTTLKKSIEEEREHEIDVSSTIVERDDRAVEEEQDDIAIPKKETSHIVESSPLSPSLDNFIVKSISVGHFEVVPFLQKKYKVFLKQVSSPRIFRWLLVTNNESANINELFDPPQDSIVHPWIIPTSSEMEMEFFTKFVPKKLAKDDKIEKFETNLNGVLAIKRDIIIDEHNLDVGGGGASSPIVERVFSGVGDGGGGEFTPNVDRCTDGVDFERGGDFGDISGGFGVGTSSHIECSLSSRNSIH
uniref:Uncharacterized protein n=1 Tax=Solanum tuberosum TaxID=4113 RepID=M1CIM2_SOLTU